MKKHSLAWVFVASLMLTVAVSTFAADKKDKAKEKTFTGTALCAKCALHETSSCQNALEVEKNGKKVTYYLVQNDVSKNFHDNVCKTSKKVTVTGTVKKVDGKMELTASKIEETK